MKYTAIIEGERVEIELNLSTIDPIEAEVGRQPYALHVREIEPGVYWLRWKDRSIEISVTGDGGAYVVSAGNQRTRVEIIDARSALRKSGQTGRSGAVEIRAPMPGKVVRVLAAEGETVEVNQGLVVIEAMKMQNEMKSPKKGIVRKIEVREAAAVNAGDLLAVVE